jgi:putative membrane protein
MPPHGPDGHGLPDLAAQHAAHGGPFFPFFGGLMFLLFLLLVFGTLMYLRRTGQLGALPWARRAQTPEHQAREILATRFATGDITSDEFIERASVLNWTPGVEPLPVPRGGRLGRKR